MSNQGGAARDKNLGVRQNGNYCTSCTRTVADGEIPSPWNFFSTAQLATLIVSHAPLHHYPSLALAQRPASYPVKQVHLGLLTVCGCPTTHHLIIILSLTDENPCLVEGIYARLLGMNLLQSCEVLWLPLAVGVNAGFFAQSNDLSHINSVCASNLPSSIPTVWK